MEGVDTHSKSLFQENGNVDQKENIRIGDMKQSHKMDYDIKEEHMVSNTNTRYARNSTKNYSSQNNGYKDNAESTPSSGVNCTLLTKMNKEEWAKASSLIKEKPYRPKTEQDYLNLTENCSYFIQKRGYHTTPLSQEEREFPLAFGIRIHHNIEQFERLLRLIYMPQNIYCVYIDLKSPLLFHQAIKRITNCFPNVFVASTLKEYIYASFSAVEADLQCMRDLLNSTVHWKYFLNVAGTELPLKTNLELVTILKLMNGTNDIEQYPFQPYHMVRYRNLHYVFGDRMVMSNLRKADFQKNVTLYKGSAYNSFSRQFIEWVLSDKLAQSFIEWSKDTYSPDETVWGSLNLWPEAPGGYPFMVTQTSKTFLSREVIWTYSAAYCYGQYVRGICMLGYKELSWLSRRWEFFANKFDLSLDYIGYECVEQWNRDRTANPDVEHSISWEIVNRLPQIKYARRK